MITGLPLQNKLRTYKKKRRKKQRQSFFQSVGIRPHRPNPTKISLIRAWIYIIVVVEKRYRSSKPSIVLPRSDDHVYICLFVNIKIKTVGWHIQQSGCFENCLISSCIAQKIESLATEHTFIFPLCAGSNPINAFFSFSSFLLYHIFTYIL